MYNSRPVFLLCVFISIEEDRLLYDQQVPGCPLWYPATPRYLSVLLSVLPLVVATSRVGFQSHFTNELPIPGHWRVKSSLIVPRRGSTFITSQGAQFYYYKSSSCSCQLGPYGSAPKLNTTSILPTAAVLHCPRKGRATV